MSEQWPTHQSAEIRRERARHFFQVFFTDARKGNDLSESTQCTPRLFDNIMRREAILPDADWALVRRNFERYAPLQSLT